MIAWIIGVVVKATLLLLGVGSCARVARRSPAATRHFLWTGGMVVLLALPALALIVPGWSPQWVTRWTPDDLLAYEAPVTGVRSLAALFAPPDSVPTGLALVTDDAGAVGGGIDPRVDPADLAERSATGTREVAPAAVAASAVARWLLVIWVAGTLVLLARLAVGFVRRARLLRGAQPVDSGRLLHAGEEAARALDLRRGARLILGRSRYVPMTWGILRPVLYLPAAALDWAPERLRLVLLHELAHIKRHDSLSRVVAQLACGVFWFHPLTWMSARRMLREQERACDDVVILAGEDPRRYAETLLQIAREFRAPRTAVVGALALSSRRSNLEHRLLSILDPLERRRKMTTSRKALVALLFVTVALPLAALRPAAAALEAEAAQSGVASARAQEGGESYRITVVREEGQILLEATGALRIPADVDDIDLQPDGSLTLTEGDRRLDVGTAADGGLSFRYSVDDVERPFDDDARAWANGVLERIGEIGDLRGNVSVRLGDSGARVTRINPGDLELSIVEPLELPDIEPQVLENLDTALENIELSVERLSEPLELTLMADDLAVAAESLNIAIEGLDSHLGRVALTLEGIEPTLEPLELSLEAIESTLEPLELSLEAIEPTLEMSLETLEPLDLTLEPLELSLDGLQEALDRSSFRLGRFDRVESWSADGSRFVVMRRGSVELGATIDDLDVDEDADLVIDERSADGRHRRLYVYAGDDGEPVFDWLVDGEPTPFDDAGRAWLRPILERLR